MTNETKSIHFPRADKCVYASVVHIKASIQVIMCIKLNNGLLSSLKT